MNKLVKESNWWKISPGKGGRDWEKWVDEAYCALYNWEEKPYYDKINKNLKDNYSTPDEFLQKTGFRGGPPNEWRNQLKTFVWNVNEGDIIFAYKEGAFVGCGKIEKNGEYYYEEEIGHIRNIAWEKYTPPLDLNDTNIIRKMSVASAGTIKNIDEYRNEIISLIQNRKIANNNLLKTDTTIEIQNDIFANKCQVIFYGPPGTGKTFNAIKKAVEFIEGGYSNEY